ncbi:putative methyltransferase-like protein 24 [Tachypleus tridentatus]|uniref:putative methyltransferase-like protein 24 n=1 Tax=Tachypleus tridentatus TaxID=6853 RepID=UPI003FD09D9F
MQGLRERGSVLEDSYKRLKTYIRHPSTLCESALSVGGVPLQEDQIDGDKVICLTPGPGLRPNCTVYSFGINDEWSFDKEMERFGCQVFAFDPSMKVRKHQYSQNIWFYRFGIAGENSDSFHIKDKSTWKLRTLRTIMKMLRHENQVIDVLKMDVEGAEWDALEEMLEYDVLQRVYHLCVEIHLHFGLDFDRKLKLLQRLENEAGFRFFSSRPNTIVKPKQVPGLNKTDYLFYELAWFKDIKSY